MNIAIVVHSYTGNALSVAEKLQEALRLKSHTVTIERINAVDENPNRPLDIVLKSVPDLTAFDAVILAAPVWAFSLSAVMKHYLNSLNLPIKKPMGCFVTMHFPFRFLGGNRAIRKMKSLSRNALDFVYPSHIVHWSRKNKEVLIDLLIEDFKNSM